ERQLFTASVQASVSAEALRTAAGRVSGLLDLTALDGVVEEDSVQARSRLELVRELVGGPLKQGERLDVVQATLGLQGYGSAAAPTTLAGAQEAGLYKSLWAEYRRCRSKTVDFAATGLSAEVLATALTQELEHHDGASELGYLGGRRMARRVEPLRLRPSEPSEPP